MRCYFWGTNNRTDRAQRGRGVISFAIPDWGVQFRAAQIGTASECEYSALLSLLRFVENNPRVFEGKKLAICTDAAALVYQVNRKLPVAPSEVNLWERVTTWRDRVPFELVWVPSEQNAAIGGVLDLAPMTLKKPLSHTHLDLKNTPDKQSPGSPRV
ncbi:MAG: hypothetical protein AB1792_06530 [Candidatus Zixiibacteriota bacterium]